MKSIHLRPNNKAEIEAMTSPIWTAIYSSGDPSRAGSTCYHFEFGHVGGKAQISYATAKRLAIKHLGKANKQMGSSCKLWCMLDRSHAGRGDVNCNWIYEERK